MKIGDKITLIGTKIAGTIVAIDPENAPYTIHVQWSSDRFGWYLKSALKGVK